MREKLDELARLHGNRNASAKQAGQWAKSIGIYFPAILEYVRGLEGEREALECEVEELKDNSIEYEKDCTKALCSLARELDYEWDGDGATADDLREFISETLADLKRRVSNLASCDAKQRREGAAEWLEKFVAEVRRERPCGVTVAIANLELDRKSVV